MADIENINCPTCSPTDVKRSRRESDLLRGLCWPEETEYAEFDTLIKEAPARIEDLDEKIAMAKDLLGQFRRARKEEKLSLEAARCLVHPIRTVPNEIMEEIFAHCVPTWDDLLTNAHLLSLSPRIAPWSLTYVSRQWRDLALSFPTLWTTLSVDLSRWSSNTAPDVQAARLARHLDYSSILGLSMRIHSTSDISGHPAMAALGLALPRLTTLAVEMDVSSLFSLRGFTFQNLELLILDKIINITTLPVVTFQSMDIVPKLRALQIRPRPAAREGSLTPDQFIFPWDQIRTFTLSTASSDGYLHLARMCNLQELCIEVYKSPESGDCAYPDELIALPQVRRLAVIEKGDVVRSGMRRAGDSGVRRAGDSGMHIAGDSAPRIILDSISMPALSDLSLHFQRDIGGRLMQYPTIRADSLTTLWIHCETQLSENRQALLEFLESTTRVEDFVLLDDAMHPEVIYGLEASDEICRLPFLRSFSIGEAALQFDITILVEMLETRIGESAVARTADLANSLEEITVPRWVFFSDDEYWRGIAGHLTVQCGTSNDDEDEAVSTDGSNFGSDDEYGSYSEEEYEFMRSSDWHQEFFFEPLHPRRPRELSIFY